MATTMKLTWHRVAYEKGNNRTYVEGQLDSDAAIECG